MVLLLWVLSWNNFTVYLYRIEKEWQIWQTEKGDEDKESEGEGEEETRGVKERDRGRDSQELTRVKLFEITRKLNGTQNVEKRKR